MPIFKVLEFEEDVQVADRTRFLAQKSYVTTLTPAISKVQIKPGVDGSFINVTSSLDLDSQWFLDYQFENWTFDIGVVNNKIDFKEGDVDFVATLSSGNYASLALLCTEIETALNGAGGSNTYTVTSDTDDKITVSATGNFQLDPKGENALVSLLPHIGFKEITENGNEVISDMVEYSHKQITLEITSDVGMSAVVETKDFWQKVFTVQGDRLFSDDSDLQQHEKDILKWVSRGRDTFKDFHREAQKEILKWISKHGYVDSFGNKLTKHNIVDIEEVNDWSKYMVLSMIFQNNSNAIDDIFAKKSAYYESLEDGSRNAFIKLDLDNDGIVDNSEALDLQSGNLFLR